jgi:hypothetical protein
VRCDGEFTAIVLAGDHDVLVVAPAHGISNQVADDSRGAEVKRPGENMADRTG